MGRVFFSLFLLVSFFTFSPLAIKNRDVPSLQDLSTWKLPLPSGEYTISQGDGQDPSCSSHCSNNPWFYCAIDIAANDGTLVLAPSDGTVIVSSDDFVYGRGKYILIQHSNGLVTQYQHLKARFVAKGDTVRTGQPIGRVDSTGYSTGPHLHFGIFTDYGLQNCVKITNLDENTNFRKNARVVSHNAQNGSAPDDIPASPILPQPTISSPETSAGRSSSLPSSSVIENYLRSRNSPLADYADVFVLAGQQYNVDPRFVVAISNAESTLGKNGDCALKRHNAWGYGGGWPSCWYFSTWQDAIWQVTADIGEYYFKRYHQTSIPSFVVQPAGTCTTHCWCASGCDHWIKLVGDAYEAMGGNRNASDLSFAAYTSPSTPVAFSSPSLISPADRSTWPAEQEITLQWTSVPSATAYRVELWGGPYDRMVPCDWVSATSCKIGKMWPGTMYWHVKARNKAGQESDWSLTWTFTIQEEVVLNPPTLREPANNVVYLPAQDVWFSWNRVDGADQYYLEYWGGPYGTLNSGWIFDTAYHIGTMWPGTYEWHVKARNSAGGKESGWSQTWTFTIQEQGTPTAIPAPNAPVLKAPGNNVVISSDTEVILKWKQSPDATEYKVELWGGPYDRMTPCNWQAATSCYIGRMWPGTMYWRVKARNTAGQESDWSETWSFTVQQQLPTATATPSFQGNIAPLANRSPDGIGSNNAFDGNLSTFWVDGLGHGFKLTLTLPGTFEVSRILVWDRPQNSPDNQQIHQLAISLSNGWSKTFEMISDGPRCIDVTLSTPQLLSFVILEAKVASGNNGLSEVEVWVGPKTSGPGCSNRGTIP